MHILKNLKISYAFSLVALVPVVLALLFSTQLILKEWHHVTKLDRLSQLVSLSVKMSDLVHEQQKERGATAVFIGSKGARFRSELSAQRQETDKKRIALNTYLTDFQRADFSTEFNQKLSAVLATLGMMDDVRSKVDALGIPAPEAIAYYTGLNGQNLGLISDMASLSPDTQIATRIVGYANFLQGKERAGIERAVGANGFSTGQFNTKALNKFKTLIVA